MNESDYLRELRELRDLDPFRPRPWWDRTQYTPGMQLAIGLVFVLLLGLFALLGWLVWQWMR